MWKFALLLGALLVQPVAAATITITLTETAQPTVTKGPVTIADSDVDQIVAAYQSAANVSVNGTATRAQVLNYMVGTWFAGTVAIMQQAQTVPAVVPPAIVDLH